MSDGLSGRIPPLSFLETGFCIVCRYRGGSIYTWSFRDRWLALYGRRRSAVRAKQSGETQSPDRLWHSQTFKRLYRTAPRSILRHSFQPNNAYQYQADKQELPDVIRHFQEQYLYEL